MILEIRLYFLESEASVFYHAFVRSWLIFCSSKSFSRCIASLIVVQSL